LVGLRRNDLLKQVYDVLEDEFVEIVEGNSDHDEQNDHYADLS